MPEVRQVTAAELDQIIADAKARGGSVRELEPVQEPAPFQYGFEDPDPASVPPEEKERVLSRGLNVPAGWLTGDPATDRRMAENAWSGGATRPITTMDAVKAGALALSGVAIPAAGVTGGVIGGGLGGLGTSKEESAGGAIGDAAKGAAIGGTLAKVAPAVINRVPVLRRAVERVAGWFDDGREAAGRAAGKLDDASPLPSLRPAPAHAPAPPPAPPVEPVASHAKKPLLARALQEPDLTPEAKFLSDRGVKLTTGLRDATSPAAHTEIASQSIMGSGPIIRSQRQRALQQSMDLGFELARPPGAPKLGATGNVNAKFAKLEAAWDTAYDAVKKEAGAIYPAIHNGRGGVPLIGTAKRPGAIARALRDPDLLADKDSINLVERFVENQFTKLPRKPGALAQVDVSDLLDIRTVLRRHARQALSSQKYEQYRLFGAAEDQITAAIESQAPEAAVARLRELDGKYRNLVTMREAVTKAKDAPGGITPQNFANAVYDVESSGAAYARGEGGEMRQLSKAIKAVFDESSAPPTGARLLAVSAVPEWARNTVVGPSIALRNSQLAKTPVSAAAASLPMTPAPGVSVPGGAATPFATDPDAIDILQMLRERIGSARAAARQEE